MEQHEVKFRMVCMDCKVVLDAGDDGAPVSHGLCDACLAVRMKQLDELKRERVA